MRADPAIVALLLLDGMSRVELAERTGNIETLHTRASLTSHAKAILVDVEERGLRPPLSLLRLAAGEGC